MERNNSTIEIRKMQKILNEHSECKCEPWRCIGNIKKDMMKHAK